MDKKSSERQKDVIIDSTHDGIISINNKGKIELFNKSAEKILNIPREKAVGKDVCSVVPNTKMHEVLAKGKAELNQIQHVGENTIITSRVPVKDKNDNIIGVVAVFRNITEVRKLAEKITNLREIQSMLKAIINSTQDAISVVDEKGKGILINPAYTRLTGLTEDDIIGKPATVDIAEGQSMHYRVLKTRQPVQGVRMKVGPAKKEVIVDAAPIIVDGELKGSVAVIQDVSEIKKLTEELKQVKRIIRHLNAKYTFDDIIGKSQAIKIVKNKAKKASRTPITVLLRGESGTGKELFAHAIHNESKRKEQKFTRVNCSALSENLLESELFGYEDGAFTGARKGGKKGIFEEANKGTVFLDEIGTISLKLQAKLLRVLQEQEIIRVGGTKTIDIDVRIIVATNINLERAIQEGTFREDLYYRLNVFPLSIPPLRDRMEDIKPLVNHIIKKFNQEYGRSVRGYTDSAFKKLMSYDWPGNVRELENIIGRAMINMGFNEKYIEEKFIPVLKRDKGKIKEIEAQTSRLSLEDFSLKEIINNTEKKVIIRALEKTDGNRTEAAKKLGIAIRSLYYKLNKYGIE